MLIHILRWISRAAFLFPAVFVVCFSLTSCGGGGGGGGSDTLRSIAAKAGFLIGAAVAFPAFQSDATYKSTLAAEFNYLTPEDASEWVALEPAADSFDFAALDALVDFAQTNGMKVKGHALIWQEDIPQWAQDIQDPAQLHAAMEKFIRTTVGRYKGRIYAWDVVNEALNDDGTLRSNVLLSRLGSGYIADVFRIAHDADPNAILLYSENDVEAHGPKFEAMLQMIQNLLNSGVPVHGVGIQAHILLNQPPPPAELADNIHRLAALGLRVNLSEMDVSVPDSSADSFNRQGAIYRDSIAACIKEPRCESVTFWGFTDKYSWLNLPGKPDYPLPLDRSYSRKPAYTATADALKQRNP